MDQGFQSGIVLTWPMLAAAVSAIATGVGIAAKWTFDRFDKLLERIEKMQQAYLAEIAKRDAAEENRRLEAEKREEDRRKEHLADIKFARDQFHEAVMKFRPDSRRPEAKP